MVTETTVINESGVYVLVLRSKLDSAKRFRRWVTSEVLPSIRKTGSYSLPKTYLEALKALVASEEEKEQLLIENNKLEEEKAGFIVHLNYVSSHLFCLKSFSVLKI